MEPPPAHKGVY